jgi:hypothetical protein
MSFSATTAQLLDGSKTVTRRMGWRNLKVGQQLWAVEKAMGLKKGEKHNRLALIEVVEVDQEPLNELLMTGYVNSMYAYEEIRAEGFPEMSPAEFVSMFCKMNGCRPEDLVTRIEFKHVEGADDA